MNPTQFHELAMIFIIGCIIGFFSGYWAAIYNKRPSPIGYCKYCDSNFYIPHNEHYENCESFKSVQKLNK